MSKSEIQVLDFEKICRLCLLEKRSMSAIFSKRKSDKKVPLPERIMSCASLQLYEGDGLPSSICNKCLMSVNQSYAFREQCEQADTTLRQYAQRLAEANEEASTNPLPVVKEFNENIVKMESDFDSCDLLETVKTEILTDDENKTENENLLEKLSSISGISVTRRSADKPIEETINKPAEEENIENILKRKRCTGAEFFKEYATDTADANKVLCKECKILINRSNFYCHVKYVHKKIKDHLCQDCGYRANTSYLLRRHVEAKHSGVVFPCSECPSTFTTAKSFSLHKAKYHSGKPVERKYVCQYCGKAFIVSCTLKKHLRVHTQETPFECQFCGKKFKYKWAWQSHEHLHTGVKPYKCTICGEAFTQNCVRKSHEYRVHGNEEFNPKNRIPGPKREKKVQVEAVDFVNFVTRISDDNKKKKNDNST